jgi:DNA-binding HxlR family transcriptional regulator
MIKTSESPRSAADDHASRSDYRITQAIALLQGKWTIQILCKLRSGPVRLGHLKRALPAASKKGLTSSLRMLEASGLVVRRDMSKSLLHVEYHLAQEHRDDLESLLDFLDAWMRRLSE